MSAGETAVVYLLAGVLVAAAARIADSKRGLGQLPLLVLAWPFFLPLLLGLAVRGAGPVTPLVPRSDPRVAEAERQLVTGFRALPDIASDVLAPDVVRVSQLAETLAAARRRIDEMDTVLASPGFDLGTLETSGVAPDRLGARRRNIERLQALRDRTAARYEDALFQLEEIAAQVHLLRFAGGPADELTERLGDLSARIDGVSEGLLTMG